MRICQVLLSLALTILVATSASAQFPTDPAGNLLLAGGPGEQVVPHMVMAGGEMAWMGWYDNSSGNYDVRLQGIHSSGEVLYPTGGIVVSDHPQNSWVMDWGLACDAQGNAIVAFADIRGGQSNIHIYRIAPDRTFLWGEDGIDVTSNTDDKGPPSVAVTNDGDILVAWYADSPIGVDGIRLQRYSPDGTPHFGANGILVSEAGDGFPTGQVLLPCGSDGFLMAYVPNYSFMANRQIKLQRFDADAQPVWENYLMVMDDGTVPMGHYFVMKSDGQDGALFAWSVASGLNFTVRAQHVDADGNEILPHNGLTVSLDGSFSQISPDLAFDPVSGDISVLYIQMDGNQTQKGVFGQRIDPFGSRAWGSHGREIVPVDTTQEGFVRAVNLNGHTMGMFFQAPQNTYGQDQIVGVRLGVDGDPVWDPALAPVATTGSNKDDLLVGISPGGTVIAAWVDDRNGTPDMYGQSLNADGTVGFDPGSPVPGLAVDLLDQNVPNPFNPTTVIRFRLTEPGDAVLRVFDSRGRLVRDLFSGKNEGEVLEVRWDGRDNAGTEVPSGVYLYRLDTAEGHQTRKMVLAR